MPQSLQISTEALLLALSFLRSNTLATFVKIEPGLGLAKTGTVTRMMSPAAQEVVAPRLQVNSGLVLGVVVQSAVADGES